MSALTAETLRQLAVEGTVWRCDVSVEGDEIHVTVAGNGFLYKMVRNLVGTLAEIGRGQWRPERIDRILESRERAYAGPTAPAHGLCLLHVLYAPDQST